MDNLLFFYFVLLTLLGVGLTALLIFFSFQRNNRLIDALALFLGFYTLDTSIGIFNQYLSVNMPELYVVFFELLVFVNLISRVALLWSVMYLLMHIVEFKRSKAIIIGYSFVLAIGAFLRGVLNETSISSIIEGQFRKIDMLDIISILSFLLVLVVLAKFRKSIVQPEKRLLADGIILILAVGCPLILLDALHVIPRLIPLNSFIFLMFVLLLTITLFKTKGFKSHEGHSESVAEVSAGLGAINLTIREKEILALLVKGLSDKEIADDLNILPSKVKSHILDIFNKMCVKNRNELVSKYDSIPHS